MADVSKDASARMLQAECRPTVELEIPAGTPFEAVLRDPDWILEIVKELGPRGLREVPLRQGLPPQGALREGHQRPARSSWLSLGRRVRPPLHLSGSCTPVPLRHRWRGGALPVDALSVIPETLWHESATGPRYRWIRPALELFDSAAQIAPVVFHGIGLSIGGGDELDMEHVEQIAAVADRYEPWWYSEHLGSFRVRRPGVGQVHAGVGLPLPFDSSALQELIPKVAAVCERHGPTVSAREQRHLRRSPGRGHDRGGLPQPAVRGDGCRGAARPAQPLS